jgi:hypothetical protein
MLGGGEELPGSPRGESIVVGDPQVPAVEVGLHGELVGTQHGNVDVLVWTGGGADEQIDCLAAGDPPVDREAVKQGGDLADGQRLPRIPAGHTTSMARVLDMS